MKTVRKGKKQGHVDLSLPSRKQQKRNVVSTQPNK